MNKADPGETQPGGCDFCPPPVCQLQKEYTRRVSFCTILLIFAILDICYILDFQRVCNTSNFPGSQEVIGSTPICSTNYYLVNGNK